MTNPSKIMKTLSIKNDLRQKVESIIPKYKQYTGKTIKIGVLDTGISKHSSLNYQANINYTEEINGFDQDGHGTHVSGIIKANSESMRGLCPDANLFSIKVLSDHGHGSVKSIHRGLISCLDNDVDIIIMSLGSRKYNKTIHEALKLCYKKGIHIFAAAGNFEDGNINTPDLLFPGRVPETICVGAIKKYDNLADFSAMGRQLDFIAPGVKIWSTWLDNKFATLSGTSQAVPMVAGIAGIILDKHKQDPGKTPITNQKDLYTHLQYLAKDIGVSGKDIKSGEGIIKPNSDLWRKYQIND